MNVTIRFTPKTIDLIWAGYAGLRARPVILVMGLVFFVGLPWLAAFLAIIGVAMGKPIGLITITTLLLVPPVAIVFIALLPVILFRGSRALRGLHTYEFSNQDIHFIGPGFDNRVDWGIVTRCIRSRAGLLFLSDRLPLVTLPNRVLSAETFRQIQELLAAKGIALHGV